MMDALVRKVQETGLFDLDDIPLLTSTYWEHGPGAPGPWDPFRHAHLSLPGWWDHDLDPWSDAYAAQQQRLWRAVSGVERSYQASVDEADVGWDNVDPVRQPGFYAMRDAGAVARAGDHLIATGMLLKHCGLRAGDRALEYGAGFAQSALALARLGVEVDTVDISPRFCEFVTRQAEHFDVPLRSFRGEFGDVPDDARRYHLIWFYESFHHCVDFTRVVAALRTRLVEGGRIVLFGEPIVATPYAAVPYPWGLRLHSEVVAVVRRHHWFELGFTEDFLFELFVRAGFGHRVVPCDASLFGRLYVFGCGDADTAVGAFSLPPGMACRWTVRTGEGAAWRGDSGRWPLGEREAGGAYEITLVNASWRPVDVRLGVAGAAWEARVPSRGAATVRVEVPAGEHWLDLSEAPTRWRVPRLPTGDSTCSTALLARVRRL